MGASNAVAVPDSDLERYEKAFTGAIIEGRSYAAVARELKVDPRTVKAWSDKYRDILSTLRTTDKLEQVIEFESRLFQGLRRADAVYERAMAQGHGLTAVGAINAAKGYLDLLIRVRGLEAPKNAKTEVSGSISISWGDDPDMDARTAD
jgi:hypothetical protein